MRSRYYEYPYGFYNNWMRPVVLVREPRHRFLLTKLVDDLFAWFVVFPLLLPFLPLLFVGNMLRRWYCRMREW